MKNPNCFHQCSGNCRRVGCNCECGEFHDQLNQSELDEIQEDTTSMEEKLEALEKLHNDPKADILADMIK